MCNSPVLSVDPLSDMPTLADARPVLSGGFTTGGSWGIRFPKPDKIKFFALINWQCRLLIDDEEEPVRVAMGDVILLSAQRSFTLASSPDVTLLDANKIFFGGKQFHNDWGGRGLRADRRACPA